jgi:hypothetical protein
MPTPPVARGAGVLRGCDEVLGHAGGADGVAIGLESARDVDGQLAVLEYPAFLKGGGALVGFGQWCLSHPAGLRI